MYALVLASFNEDDKLLMMAKINFFATQVGQHANIINFIGAVTDNIHRKYSVFFSTNLSFPMILTFKKKFVKMLKGVIRSNKSNDKQCSGQTTCTCYHTDAYV
jgi:hypothetical protein